MSMTDYDDDKPNWREVDRQKDKSRFYGRQDKDSREKELYPKDRWQQGKVKTALDRLFKGDKGTLEHDRYFTRLHNAYGSDAFLGQAKKYIAKYGLPDDVRTLLFFLDLNEVEIAMAALEKLVIFYKSMESRQQEDMKRKVSIAAMSHRRKEVRIKAEETLEKLNS